MNILLAYHNKQSQIGGVESWVVTLYHALRARGHRCEVFWLGANVMDTPESPCPDSHNGTMAELLQFVTIRHFDVIHASTADWDSGVALLRRAAPRTRLVLTNHLESCSSWNSANCDALVGCSASAARAQQQWTDLPVRAVLNGIDTERFTPPPRTSPGSPIVAWVGRGGALKHKRIDKLAAVAPLLHAAGIRLRIADPDGPACVIPEAARILGSIAEFWGRVPRDGMPAFLQSVAESRGCVLSTAAYEGLPLALVEAQAAGCPVIAADVSGVNECVDPAHGGLLYAFDTPPEELACLTISMLGNPGEMDARRQACVRHARDRFGLTRMADAYLSIYREVLARKSNGPSLDYSYVGTLGRQLRKVGFRKVLSERWAAGHTQYRAALKLMDGGDWDLARLAAKASFANCPSLYVRPTRLSQLFRALGISGLFRGGSSRPSLRLAEP